MKDIRTYHWTPKLKRALKLANTDDLEDITEIALEVISRIPNRVDMVFGPITSGGLGNLRDNVTVMKRAIHILWHEENRDIFSQLPFKAKMLEFKRKWDRQYPEADYCWPIMVNFYRKLFASGRISQGNFLYGWEESTGTKWEHEFAPKYRIAVRHLPMELTKRIVRDEKLAVPIGKRPTVLM